MGTSDDNEIGDLARPLSVNDGYCPICERDTRFNAWGANLRDTYLCGRCGSIPRERALMHAIELFYPHWRTLIIHESSPAERGVSPKLQAECPQYLSTQFHPTVPEGYLHPTDGWRCENLERQTFGDEQFDLVITQDVLEHIFDPDAACREIARTLRKGGAHIATTPLVRKTKPSIRCASLHPDGTVEQHHPPEYHGNPVDGSGSLVTFWWGYDLANRIDTSAPFNTLLYHVEDPGRGISGPLNEVLVCFKI
ncbi:MAG TPA: class I SAM-dependent methyltransferase [Aurantimonas coralicida]|uniref:Class I SAM-dependent methyltransferase n=2 Tax=root TaxID=1 RepID=A0A9C9TFU0_9HYPH|nr:class I SAM-dependent methyltransferase [Aurantimonas coralicida]HET99070.1 class I SAM-dependent methyltransferase [Aurantimonas coralicida]